MTEPANLEPLPPNVVQNVFSATAEGTEAMRLRSKPGGLIYHYCDANALLSILNHRSVWATDTNYLNDSKELVSLFDSLKHHLPPGGSPASELVRAAIIEFAEFAPGFRANLIGMSSFVACFSEDGDVLSQWRAYADNGMGFAIGFDPTDLVALTGEKPSELRRMMYGGSVEEEIVLRYVDQVVEAIREIETEFDRFGYPQMSLSSWLRLRTSEFFYELAFECKHPAFNEEREWRILARGGEMLFRASSGKLVPYKTLDMTSISNPSLMPVKEIVIGPCTNSFEAERVLTYLADKLGYGHSGIRFRKSGAPCRR
jgi:hypothetical protein